MFLEHCPHCGSTTRLVQIQNGYAIVCNDKNCLGQMRITFGSCDDRALFLEKLVANWNGRKPEVRAVTAAINCLEQYRDELYAETQEPYDDHGACCMAVADEMLHRLKCFTTNAAVDAWMQDHDE